MPIPDKQWIVVSPTEFPWEQDAFDFIKEKAPSGTVGAWSNFEFVTPNGAIYEVDLMVLTITELFLIEIKSWGGVLDGTVNNLMRYGHNPQDARSVPNPLLLLNKKAKILASMLKEQPALRNQKVPFVRSILFFNNPSLHLKIPAAERPNIFHHQEIIAGLAPKDADKSNPQKKLDLPQVKALTKAFGQLGIRRQNRTAKVGDWILDELLEDTERYQDHLAHHASISESFRRVRTYTIPPKAPAAQQEIARRAARREFSLTDTLQHPGILKPLEYKEHEFGPALVYFYDREGERLDHYLAGRNATLDNAARLDLVRQLADILRYAHARRVYHRGLSPQNVLVLKPDSPRPLLQVMNWQTGMELEGTAGTSHITALLDDASKAYMAPEACNKPSQSPGDLMDIFALGAVAYHILTGQPPAESHIALYQKLQDSPGLRLSTVTDGLGGQLESLIERCTHRQGSQRPSSLDEVLEALDTASQELGEAEQQEVFNPLLASPGSELPGGFRVVRDLGKGSVSRALEVERDGNLYVLKVAHEFEQNERMEEEAQALDKLKHPNIVTLEAKLEMGGRTCLLLQRAGETLAHRLADWGPLQLEQLERFGTDLLSALMHMEKAGVRHRDIKPANLGITPRQKGAPRLLLFDFSLAAAPVESIGAGTPDYIDPFLKTLKPPRWDQSAERYAAALTLYEMATGTLPRWGDGKSDPGLDPEVKLELEPERFDPALRETLSEFFEKALHRNRADRFDNAEEMLVHWTQALKADGEAAVNEELSADELAERIAQATLQSSLASLGLDIRLLRALDRLGALTVEQLLALSGGTLHTATGVGARTRKRLVALQEQLRERFPENPLPIYDAFDNNEAEHSVLEEFLTLILSDKSAEKGLRAAFLGQTLKGDGLRWPTLSELAKETGNDPMKVAKLIPSWRREWARLPHLRFIRTEVHDLLSENSGLLSGDELALGLLSRHGALSNDTELRLRLAGSVARAALEAESTEPEAHFLWNRVGGAIVVATSEAHLRYLEQLGQVADRLAAHEPLLSPKRALDEVRAVAHPDEEHEIAPHRLLRLAALCSGSAAVSSREEFYPRGLDAQRALILAHGALVGEGKLTPAEVRARVMSRYPEAQPLPSRPALDILLQAADPDLVWSEKLECYVRRALGTSSSGSTAFRRYSTASGTRAPATQPEVAEAKVFEERLQYALKEDSFLVLMVEPGVAEQAETELLRRFGMRKRQLDRMLISSMRATAAAKNADWQKVLAIDAQPGSNAWKGLNRLVGDAVKELEQELLASQEPQLLTNPSLLKRYGQLGLLEKLRDLAGTRDGVPAVWLLLPSESTSDLPTLDGEAIALIESGQRASIPTSWLENRHRAGKAEVPS